MRDLTLIYPYYCNPQMLEAQLSHLRALPEDLISHLHVIVVDDGSPEPARIEGEFPFELSLYRFDVDIRWGWLQARNLGVSMAKSEWVLMTDIDHIVPEATMRKIMTDKLDTGKVYRFSRVSAPDWTPFKPHPNSWMMTRSMFDKIGGYDERFLGLYGTDGEFRDRVVATCKEVVILPCALLRVPREVVQDASTTTYGRKEPQDKVGMEKARARIAKQGGRPVRGLHPWRRIR